MSMREHVVEQRANDQPPTVMVIDDDPGVRDSLGKLLRSAGFRVSLLGSVSEFLAADLPEGPACLVLDVRLPGQSGLELQRELAGAKRQLPIIFITGHGDIPMSVQKRFRSVMPVTERGLSRNELWQG
jgi:FixJ family two-component response regulator